MTCAAPNACAGEFVSPVTSSMPAPGNSAANRTVRHDFSPANSVCPQIRKKRSRNREAAPQPDLAAATNPPPPCRCRYASRDGQRRESRSRRQLLRSRRSTAPERRAPPRRAPVRWRANDVHGRSLGGIKPVLGDYRQNQSGGFHKRGQHSATLGQGEKMEIFRFATPGFLWKHHCQFL